MEPLFAMGDSQNWAGEMIDWVLGYLPIKLVEMYYFKIRLPVFHLYVEISKNLPCSYL